MKILIKITKEVLEKTKMCGIEGTNINQSCAIAYAVRELFPLARVGTREIAFDGRPPCDSLVTSTLSSSARWFISNFDNTTPELRPSLSEFSFEIEVPASVIDKIGIGEAYRVLSESKTLELVSID